jgi:D-alanyl-D-alanine dipeptidase
LTSREALRIFDVADIWAARTGQTVRLVSANDHVHSRASSHYEGLAVDLHSSANDLLALAMRQAGFLVLWKVPGHFGHVHVEAAGQDAARALAVPSRLPRPRRRVGD